MRKTIDAFLQQYPTGYKQDTCAGFMFLHNDMWDSERFKSAHLPFVRNFKSSENMIWGYAYSLDKLSGKYPIVYSVSFFNIGRFEQFRKFFLLDKFRNILILNAGHVGYSSLPEAHHFNSFNEEDFLKNYDIMILDQNDLDTKEKFLYLLERYTTKGGRYYIKLGKDGLYD